MKFPNALNRFAGVKRVAGAVVVSAVLAASLAGCSSSSSSASASAGGSASGAPAASIVVGTGQTCSSLDPLNSYDGWYMIRYGVCQTLTKMNNDMSISGWMIEDKFESNNDNTTWTFTVKDGIKFSNGKACDGAAVKASLQNVCDNGVRSIEYFTPKSIEADGQKVTITLDSPDPILPNKLADPYFSIIDTEAYGADVAAKGPIGTGPFVFTSFDATTQEVKVAANDNYWGEKAKTQEISFVYTEEQTTLTNGLKNGTFDAVYNVSMNDVGEFEADSKYAISKTASGRTTHGFINQHGIFGDDALRQALLMSLDKETFCSVLLKGQYVAGKSLITSSADFGFSEIADPYAYNPEAAVKLLDEAGYKDIDGDGMRETPKGEKMDIMFTYYTGRPEQKELVEATCQEMAKIGIKISPDVHDSATVQNLLKNGEYDLLCMSINVLNCADPVNHMKTYFSEGGSYSTAGWNNAEFTKLVAQADKTGDAAERRALIVKAQQEIANDGAAIFFCYPLMNFVMASNVSGIESTTADYYWVNENTVKM